MKLPDSQNGQVALIVLAVMAIALTLGLTLSQRVIVDLEMTEEEEKSAQAFSAAEGGVEEALRILDQGGDIDTELDVAETAQIASDLGVSRVSIQSTALGGETTFVYPLTISPGDFGLIWLREHQSDGSLDVSSGYNENTIDVCWEGSGALQVIYFYQDSLGNYNISRHAFDQDSSRSSNNFSDVNAGGCAGLPVSASISELTSGGKIPLFLVFKPFYDSAVFGVEGTAGLPVQGHEITSTGEVDRSEDEVISRRVKVFRGWDMPSNHFFHAVFSSTGVTTQ